MDQAEMILRRSPPPWTSKNASSDIDSLV